MRVQGVKSIPGSLIWLGALVLNATMVWGIKFELEAEHYPRPSEPCRDVYLVARPHS